MNPIPMPVAIEKVSGVVIVTMIAGRYSETSSHSRSRRARIIRQATKTSAGAVA